MSLDRLGLDRLGLICWLVAGDGTREDENASGLPLVVLPDSDESAQF